ncbi:CocE/NonD family hydrolase [Streptomyces sp. NPDC004288]
MLLPEKLPEGKRLPVILMVSSFDAWTGLLGDNAKKRALKAVVIQEPIWDLYRHSHSHGVPRLNGIIAPTTYNAIATIPPLPDDDKRYRRNAAYEQKHPECAATATLAGTVDPGDPFWTQRDAIAGAKAPTPRCCSPQGLTENNTKPLGMEEYLAHHRGVERGWIGPWDHVRGNERDADGKLAMGRAGWLKEAMAFFDEHLKGEKPVEPPPNFAVQDNSGVWREEKTWPDATSTPHPRRGRPQLHRHRLGFRPEAGRRAGRPPRRPQLPHPLRARRPGRPGVRRPLDRHDRVRDGQRHGEAVRRGGGRDPRSPSTSRSDAWTGSG